MANTVYISAGLPVAKNTDQSPTAGTNTAYISAGLPPIKLPDTPPLLSLAISSQNYSLLFTKQG